MTDHNGRGRLSRESMGSRLTHDELRIASEAELDLGVGYPEFSLPAWLHELWYDLPLGELTWRYLDCTPGVRLVSGQSLPRSVDLTQQLCRTMLRYLGLEPSLENNSFVTYSGSHAIERSLATLLEPERVAVTTTPSIDIITAMLRERNNVAVRHVAADVAGSGVHVARLQEVIRGDPSVLILTSPENPTGYTYSAGELAEIVGACVSSGTPLVLDQCFCKVSPVGDSVPLLPNLAHDDLSFLFVWDTGKTFDLDDDKVGFIVCSDDLVASFRDRLAVLQCTLPKRMLMLMKLVIEGAMSHHYGDTIREVVADNLREVVLAMTGTGVEVLTPRAGGFVLLDISPLGVSSAAFSEGLLAEERVGVVSASSFFHDGCADERYDRYVRLALLRDRDELRRAMHRIRRYALTFREAASGGDALRDRKGR